MKKTIFGLAVILGAILFTPSCEKEPINSGSGLRQHDLMEELHKINAQYSSFTQTRVPTPSALKTVVADCGAGWTGGEWGASLGPWGAFAGALVGGVAGSLYYIYASPAPPLGNGTGGSYAVNQNNPYDYVGTGHNILCAEILSEDQSLYVNNHVVNMPALYNRLCILAADYWNKTVGATPVNGRYPVLHTVANVQAVISFTEFQAVVAASTQPLVCDAVVSEVTGSYVQGMPGAEVSKASFLAYTLQYENSVAQSNAVSASDKMGLFCYFAIARNSYMFWN